MSEVDDFFLKHGLAPKRKYDPVKAREYYLRTRELKGRKKAAFSKPVKRTPSKKPSEDQFNLKGFDYRGGKWYDKSGKLVGTAKEEDSEIKLVPGAKIPLKDGTTYVHGSGTGSLTTKDKVASAQKKMEKVKTILANLKAAKANPGAAKPAASKTAAAKKTAPAKKAAPAKKTTATKAAGKPTASGLVKDAAKSSSAKMGAAKTGEQLRKEQSVRVAKLETRRTALKSQLDAILAQIKQVSGTATTEKGTSTTKDSAASAGTKEKSDLTSAQKADAAKAAKKSYEKNKDTAKGSDVESIEADIKSIQTKIANAKAKLKDVTEKAQKSPSKK